MRRYWIRLRGFDGHEVLAPTASKAKAQTFRYWCDAGYDDGPRRRGERPFHFFLSQIEVLHALGDANLDPRTPAYGVAR